MWEFLQNELSNTKSSIWDNYNINSADTQRRKLAQTETKKYYKNSSSVPNIIEN